MQEQVGHLTDGDASKTGMFNAFFPFFLTPKMGPGTSGALIQRGVTVRMTDSQLALSSCGIWCIRHSTAGWSREGIVPLCSAWCGLTLSTVQFGAIQYQKDIKIVQSSKESSRDREESREKDI